MIGFCIAPRRNILTINTGYRQSLAVWPDSFERLFRGQQVTRGHDVLHDSLQKRSRGCQCSIFELATSLDIPVIHITRPPHPFLVPWLQHLTLGVNYCHKLSYIQEMLYIVTGGLVLSCLASATQVPARYHELENTAVSRANAVKETFQVAWNGYHAYAFPNDQLLPVNDSFDNTL